MFSKSKIQTRIFTLVLFPVFLASCGGLRYPHDTFKKEWDLSLTPDTKPKVSFHFIDVGQGDATLIAINDKGVLIDAGTAEMGRERVLPLLIESGVDLVLIIASHYDFDHIGGIPEILKGPDGKIKTADDIIPEMGLLDRGESVIDSSHLSDYSIVTSDLRFSLGPGGQFEIDGVVFTIAAQNGEFMDGTKIDIDPGNENAHSISLLIRHGEIRYLTSGDLPGPNFKNQYEPYDFERHLPELVGDIDILHVSHHGSHNSTRLDFLKAIKPEIAIISVGENDFGHPHPYVLENLGKFEAKVYSTQEYGDISIVSDGNDILILE